MRKTAKKKLAKPAKKKPAARTPKIDPAIDPDRADAAAEVLQAVWLHEKTCKVCGADPTHLVEAEPTLYCSKCKPDCAAELCQGCRPRATGRNHPPGVIFVGWSHGWQPCQRCGGSGLERARHCDDEHCELPYGFRALTGLGST